MSRRAWVLLALALAGCPTINNARYCDSNTACVDPRFATCDVARKQCVAGSTEADMSVPAIEDLAMPRDLAQLDLAMPSMDLAVAQDAGQDAGGADMAVVDMAMAACGTSASCPDPSPICESMMCRTCSDANDHAQCALHNASTPKCKLSGTNQGRCVVCNTSADCTNPAAPYCTSDGTCRDCRAHGECASGVCNLTAGTCVSGGIVYVNNNTCDGSPTGAQNDPYCDIGAALGTIGGAANKSMTIQVAGSNTAYPGAHSIVPTFGDSNTITVTVIGPGKSAPLPAMVRTTGERAFYPQTNSQLQRVTLTLDGLYLVSGDSNGRGAVRCDAAQFNDVVSLTIRDSIIEGGSVGVNGNDECSVTLTGNYIIHNDRGVELDGTNVYAIANNFFSGNFSRGVIFSSTATGTFTFNTVAYNGSAGGAGGIDCGAPATARVLFASIVAYNSTLGGSQFAGSCNLQTVVTGTDSISSPGKITSPPTLASNLMVAPDLHLKVSDSTSVTANQACCIDKITMPLPTPAPSPLPTDDIDGLKTRPLGASRDVGADEAL